MSLQATSGRAAIAAPIEPPAASVTDPGLVVDVLAIVRPRIAVLSLGTVAVGAVAGAGGLPDLGLLAATLLGSGLVAAGSSAWNQLLERDVDARMERTRNRPLPTGRMRSADAFGIGLLATAAGLGLLVATAGPLAAAVAAAIVVLYVGVYTPLKRVTSLNTVVGAIPGALPPLIGWAAVRGELGAGAWALFAIVFFWQFPHFLAIARLCRDDYARAGLRMLSVVDAEREGPGMIGLQAASFALVLLPASLWPAVLGVAGPSYFMGALVLGVAFLVVSIAFAVRSDEGNARRLLRASVLYLPALFAFLVLDLPAVA